MEIRITNGALLHQLYSDSAPTLIGAFQYSSDAESLAKVRLEADAKHKLGAPSYIVTCVYSGTMQVFRPAKAVSQ